MATPKIPDELKKDMPQTPWGKMLVATPVVMTVIATLLAGLASSEMTRAQYDRAYGAQLQSKAGDQWSYFQAKKLRGAMQRNSIELLQATADVKPLPSTALGNVPPAVAEALEKGTLPAAAKGDVDAEIKTALETMEHSRPEPEIAEKLKLVNPASLASALQTARDTAGAFDVATDPIVKGIDQSQKSFQADKVLSLGFAVARMRFNANRYDVEARMNQHIASLLELQVRQANMSAERHHKRSGRFFLGMLSAQAAVIVSTFAMAARQRNLLWTLAAIAGVAAVIFAIYVYVKV
ncbi:MAG TPA: DUF4337 family protein [Roseimicrobium sp.]|nr:DUF4337 family protein [Roseimicrobium sp.]